MSTRVGINGFGRIGRAFTRLAAVHPEIEVVAINDLGEIDNLAYLLSHDSVYRNPGFPVSVQNGSLMVNGKEVKVTAEKDPSLIPWKAMNVDVVVESTGVFESYEKAKAHLVGGAKRVVISAPSKDADTNPEGAMVLMGINTERLQTCKLSSNASCTTNAGSPVVAILDEKLGIEKALLNTVHAYTGTQELVDSSAKKDFLRGRGAAQNIVPSSTGAASATGQVLPNIKGKFDGISIRVPVPVGSIADITFISKRDTSVDEVNSILRSAGAEARWQGVFRASDEPLVSSDIIGDTHGSIADLSLTKVVGGNLVKVFAWYDNEMGYANMLVRHVIEAGKYL